MSFSRPISLNKRSRSGMKWFQCYNHCQLIHRRTLVIKTGAMCVCVSQGVSLRGGGGREEQKLKTEREREKKNIKSFKKKTPKETMERDEGK